MLQGMPNKLLCMAGMQIIKSKLFVPLDMHVLQLFTQTWYLHGASTLCDGTYVANSICFSGCLVVLFGHKATCWENLVWCIIRIASCYWCIRWYIFYLICQNGYVFYKHLHETHDLTQNVNSAPCYKFHECAKFNQDNSFAGHWHVCTQVCATHTAHTVNN